MKQQNNDTAKLRMGLVKFLTIVMLLGLNVLFSTSAEAQTDPEYLMEIGGGVGMMSYEGDFNGSVLKCMQPSAAIVWRRLLNPRQGFRVALDYGKLKSSSDNVTTAYPDYTTAQYSAAGAEVYKFSKTLIDLDGTYEYNFWPYGTGREYRGAKRLTPFVFAGFGFTYATGNGSSAFTANVPLGLGIKYRIGDRTNINIEWAMHFSLSDKLDGVVDPYYVESTSLFKNDDCYSAFMVSLTYSFKEKCRVCHNQDE